MINVYDPEGVLIEPHLVNGRPGFVVRLCHDDDEIFFEDYAMLRSWIQELDEQSAAYAPHPDEQAESEAAK